MTATHLNLADFMRGETALVYARWRDNHDADPYFLVDGTAADPQVKALAPRLECLMPECDDRRLQIVNRHSGPSGYRDGFRHGRGVGNHSPESIFHMQAKQTLVRWIAGLGLDVKVCVEGWSPSRERRADVMASWSDGRQVAFEVQYSPLSVPEWMERHESYRAQGIVDVWLFANTRTHLREAPGKPDDARTSIKFSELHRACARDAVPVLFNNPVDALVGTTYASRDLNDRSFLVPPSDDDTTSYIDFDSLADCTLSPGTGLVTPTLATLTKQALAYREAQQAAREAEEALGAARRAAKDRRASRSSSGPLPGRVRHGALPSTPKDNRLCVRCGEPLPYWQRGGACPEFGCWPHKPDCLFAKPERVTPAIDNLLNRNYGPEVCPVCG